MKMFIFAFSDKGCVLAKNISAYFENSVCYTINKFADKHKIEKTDDIKTIVSQNFITDNCLVFVGAVGIAMRLIAPYIKDKSADPAVICIDECANFVIPILSGHIGGANETALSISKKTKATAVITTATDINGKFAVDQWAKENHLFISDMQKAKQISAQILIEDVEIKSVFDISGNLPTGVINFENSCGVSQDKQRACFEITYKSTGDNLRLVPKVLTVGIGCKKNTPIKNVEKLFLDTLAQNCIDINSINKIASIDIKQNETAILSLAKKYNIPFVTFSKEELESLKGDFSASQFVKNVIGVDNVCERSAVYAADNGMLLIKKIPCDGVTIAVAKKDWSVKF